MVRRGSSGEDPEFAADAAKVNCVSCKHHGLLPILDLGPMPRSDGLLDAALLERGETLLPLRLGYCPECSLVQLLETRPPEEMFGENYYYFSSFSEDLLKHSCDNALELIAARRLGPDNLVVEIASNDGYMLQNFKEKGHPGPRHRSIHAPRYSRAREGNRDDHRLLWHSASQRCSASQGKRADLIIANNVVAHVAEQNDLVAGMAELLTNDGVVVVEFPYVRDLVDFTEFDTIYHEHLCYFSVGSAKTLFRRHGLYLNDVRRLPIHGGSLRLTFGKIEAPSEAVATILAEEKELGLNTYAYYENFGTRVRDFRIKARALLGKLKAEGKRIAAYGAAAKGTIMLNFLDLNSRVIEYVVDRNPHKQGKFMPGVRVPIDAPERLATDRPDYVVILPWNFRDEIIRQQQDFLKSGGKFVVPVSDLEIVSA